LRLVSDQPGEMKAALYRFGSCLTRPGRDHNGAAAKVPSTPMAIGGG